MGPQRWVGPVLVKSSMTETWLLASEKDLLETNSIQPPFALTQIVNCLYTSAIQPDIHEQKWPWPEGLF